MHDPPLLGGGHDRARGHPRDSFDSLPPPREEDHHEARLTYRSCRILTLGGTPIRVHSLFWVHLVLGCIAGFVNSVRGGLLAVLLYGPVLLLTIVIHELGHVVATRWAGGTTDTILLWPFGGLAFSGRRCNGARSAWIAIAGPLTHIPQALVWYGLGSAAVKHGGGLPFHFDSTASGATFWRNLCFGAVFFQVLLFAVNLVLTVYPLDGSRLLTIFLLHNRRMDVNAAAKVTLFAAVPVSAGLLGWAIYLWYVHAVTGAITLAVALWGYYQAFRVWQFASSGTAHMHPLFRDTLAGLQDANAPRV